MAISPNRIRSHSEYSQASLSRPYKQNKTNYTSIPYAWLTHNKCLGVIVNSLSLDKHIYNVLEQKETGHQEKHERLPQIYQADKLHHHWNLLPLYAIRSASRIPRTYEEEQPYT